MQCRCSALNDVKFICSFLAKKKYKYGYKLYLSSHGFFFHTRNFYMIKILYMHYIIRYLRLFNVLFCVSDNDFCIAKKYKLNNAILLFPGVDIDKYKDVRYFPSENNVFLYWGRIAANKGLYEAINKISLIDEEYTFYIIGNCDDINYLNKLKKLIIKKNINNKVVILNNINDDELKNYLKKSEFIIMPSLYEGFGITLIEALSTNRKIIANKNKSYASILNNCKCEEYIFDFTDNKSNIKNKINQLRSKSIIPKNLEEYSIESINSKLLYYYKLK